ncbi:hypothetical protein [Polaribacter butkevichii]|uniref:Uncharacterized protein n=1 Tax=Polaribacter butkevichii TaxID=218490 RepID=A0A2P6C6A8_9FLAO|nr:hypothetical protein [Polaribacter butkevichii]PQJ65918.1 hypothetical protein BTO14_16965 [Polaribacter butkevichii]
MKIKKILTIIGQVIVLSIISLIGIIFIYMNIPGNGAICDAESIFLLGFILTFTILIIGFIINTINFHNQGKWKKYRIISIIYVCTLVILSISFRGILFSTTYGKQKIVIESNSFPLIKLELYESGRFFSNTLGIGCETENIGTFSLNNNVLKLNYNNEKSEYLGTKYKIENKNVICLDCKNKSELRITKGN